MDNNSPNTWGTLSALSLSVVSSVVAVLYVAPLPQPSFYGVAVKLLPCLALFLYVWMVHRSSPEFSASRSSWETVLYILGIGSSETESYSDQQHRKVKSRASGSPKTFELRRNLAVRMTRGLVFSMLGDVFLIWHEHDTQFLLGVAFFAVAQGCYIHGLGFQHVNIRNGVLAYLLMVSVTLLLLSGAPVLFRYLTPCYAVLLSTTLWRALDRCSVADGRPMSRRRAMVLGAIVFVMSDSSIALFKFVVAAEPVVAQTIILSTYFTAQHLLIVGAM